MYCYFASTGQADMMCSTVLSKCLQSLHLLSVSVLIFLLHDILFVMLDLVLLLFHFSVSVTSAPNSRRNVSSLIKLSL